MKEIAIVLLVVCFVSLIAFIFVSYFVLKWLKMGIDDNNVLFYHYNKHSQHMLDTYGDCTIQSVYLLRQPFTKLITFLLNLLTVYKYESLIQQSHENFPYHTLLIFEVEVEVGVDERRTKWLLLEKNNCINLTDTFVINNAQEKMKLKLKVSKSKSQSKSQSKSVPKTIRDILVTTQNRIGNHRFFNWHLYKNNCQEFTKEILKTMHLLTPKTKEFIFRDKLFNLIIPSEFTLHVGNCLCVLYNIVEKYVVSHM